MDSSMGEHRLGEPTRTDFPYNVAVNPSMRYENHEMGDNPIELTWGDKSTRSDSLNN